MHVRLYLCFLALLPSNLTQCMMYSWLPCIVPTYNVQAQPPFHHLPLHYISVEEGNRNMTGILSQHLHLSYLVKQSFVVLMETSMYIKSIPKLFKGKIGWFIVNVSYICLEVIYSRGCLFLKHILCQFSSTNKNYFHTKFMTYKLHVLSCIFLISIPILLMYGLRVYVTICTAQSFV